MLKLFDPNISEQELIAAREVLQSKNWASGAGTGKVHEFEQKFRDYLQSRDAVAVNSGTAALHLALSIQDPKNKFVFIPSLSFVSTAHAVLFNNAKPIFVDVDKKTLCMDPVDLEEKIKTASGDSISVIPVHFAGMPCNMNSIMEICKNHDLHLIDDAAHICGGEYAGKKIGGFEEMTCFSFHPVKNLSMPTGGAITINSESSEEIKKRLNSLRWCGIDNRIGNSYDVTSISPNYYMNEISAAIGIIQLDRLDVMNRKRAMIAKRYSQEIDLEEKMQFDKECVYHLYWIKIENRDNFIEYMNNKGIEVGTHYRPIHSMTIYRQFGEQSLPVTNEVANNIVTIPIHTNLKDDEVSYIIDTVNRF
jgi:perosamine synthetase